MEKATTTAIICLACVGILGIVTTPDVQTVAEEQKHYCEMVRLGREHTDLGWPDYRGNYDTTCMEPR
ncbi:hypothetical protein [Kineobactrum salinum]|uniref:Uncharacterized protein n=1 Tax=Kineobactrum salinum TaxID=2708301 RepID=A0A6C0U578_9GAMM|nr:hypothetical protein [Kineobactrum salinum]QIB67136.1 hypothetical protein G3T16_18760 [Kineobactrum salinum]